ncbi:MAG: right-handed parallel beta-helix repeat-containing protein [Myxococcales bacterium]|nr:right-handed parallel beta-helix repeat-containing protein [Myxococcota bacterium]MDW8281749.1 right-handed parallel beta-helix repeat-containing protein [Myxococcales bacterium]
MRWLGPSVVGLAVLSTLGCDLRSFWGEAFLSEPAARPCGDAAPCPAGQRCDAEQGVCREAVDLSPSGCRDHAACGPAGLCRLDESFPGATLAAVGACLPPDRLCIVDGDRCLPGGDGTSERPLCDPQEAAARGGRCAFALVRARADGRRYGGLRLLSGALVVVGPGRDAPAVLGGVEVAGGASLTLLDVGVENPDRTAVRCGEGGRLTLVRVAVQGSDVGVEAQGCEQIVVEASRINGNRNDGLHLVAQEFRVVNTLVLGNGFDPGASASGVYIKGGRGTFAFNTVVSNGRMGQDGGGISCTAGPERFVLLTDSIVSGNGVGAMRTQFVGSCRPERVVVGSDALGAPGLIKMDPQLDPVTFRLTPRSTCCIDRAQRDPTVRTDHEGTPRPQGGGYDIGCHELK